MKRLKHRQHLEAAGERSQYAVIVDVPAMVLADQIAALLWLVVLADDGFPQSRRCAHAKADHALSSNLPRPLLGIGDILRPIARIFKLFARTLRLGSKKPSSSPRNPSSAKPHLHLA